MSVLSVGDKLYFVPSDRGGHPSFVEVAKVGRKWAKVKSVSHGYDFGQIALNGWWMDGGQYSSPGRCYASKEEHDEKVRLEEAWSALQNSMRGRLPDGLTIEDLRYAASILKVEPKWVSE